MRPLRASVCRSCCRISSERGPPIAALAQKNGPLGLTRSRCVSSGEAAEDGAGHQAGAARVIVEDEAADDLPGRVEAGDRALDLGIMRDLEATEGKATPVIAVCGGRDEWLTRLTVHG